MREIVNRTLHFAYKRLISQLSFVLTVLTALAVLTALTALDAPGGNGRVTEVDAAVPEGAQHAGAPRPGPA